jgi:UDP-GlcNAc:undecaprenyl-phosphate GlcNAc-1-phosphate transferase
VGIFIGLAAGAVSIAIVRPGGIAGCGWMLACAGLIACVGFYDDLVGLPARRKLAAHLVVTSLYVWQVGPFIPPGIGFEGSWPLVWLVYGATFLWLVGLTNAVNLIDGLDGLAVGTTMLVVAGLWAAGAAEGSPATTALLLVLGGSIIGFLPHNWPVARMFLGDGGALPLGFLLAALSLDAGPRGGTPPLIAAYPLALFSYPIFDTLAAIARRWPQWSVADREHLHHRVLDRSGSVVKAVALICMVQAGAIAATTLAVKAGSLPALAAATVAVYGVWLWLYRRGGAGA